MSEVDEEQDSANVSDVSPRPAQEWSDVMTHKPPLQRFVSGQGWQPALAPYVLAVDVKGRMSVGYAIAYDAGGYHWAFAKPIGEPTHWMPLPDPPSLNAAERETETQPSWRKGSLAS